MDNRGRASDSETRGVLMTEENPVSIGEGVGRIHPHLKASAEDVAAFCRRWEVDEMALFGSILTDDFRTDSDIDVLIRFAAEPTPGLFGLVRMEDELAGLFGRPVDLLTRDAIENSRNYIRRRAILDSLRVVYAA